MRTRKVPLRSAVGALGCDFRRRTDSRYGRVGARGARESPYAAEPFGVRQSDFQGLRPHRFPGRPSDQPHLEKRCGGPDVADQRRGGCQQSRRGTGITPSDEELRMATLRAVYGDSGLTRNSLGPDPPIHIVVRNGHVMLVGVVRHEVDRSDAYARAVSAAGVSNVTNQLQTTDQQDGTQ